MAKRYRRFWTSGDVNEQVSSLWHQVARMRQSAGNAAGASQARVNARSSTRIRTQKPWWMR